MYLSTIPRYFVFMAMMVHISHEIQPHDRDLQFKAKSNQDFIFKTMEIKENYMKLTT